MFKGNEELLEAKDIELNHLRKQVSDGVSVSFFFIKYGFTLIKLIDKMTKPTALFTYCNILI